MVHVGAQGSDGGTSDYFKKMIPMGRLGTADELASAAVFPASDESRFITGIDWPVDGGTVSTTLADFVADLGPAASSTVLRR